MNEIDDKEKSLEYRLAQMLVLSTQLSKQINDALALLYVKTEKTEQKDSAYEKMLDKPLAQVLTLDNRTHNVLRTYNIKTIRELTKCSVYDLQKMNNLGRKSLELIKDELNDRNLNLSVF